MQPHFKSMRFCKTCFSRYFRFRDTMTLLVLGFRPILSPGKKSSIFFLGSPENTQLQPSPVLLRVSEQRTRKQNHLPYHRIPCNCSSLDTHNHYVCVFSCLASRRQEVQDGLCCPDVRIERIGFRTLLATSETLSTLTASIRHDRPEISVARSKILLFIEDHERWRRSIGFDFTFNDGKIMAFRTSDRALEFVRCVRVWLLTLNIINFETPTLSLTQTQVQTFNGMYCAAGGGYVYKSDDTSNMSEFLA